LPIAPWQSLEYKVDWVSEAPLTWQWGEACQGLLWFGLFADARPTTSHSFNQSLSLLRHVAWSAIYKVGRINFFLLLGWLL
jgi:hypothetical protein